MLISSPVQSSSLVVPDSVSNTNMTSRQVVQGVLACYVTTRILWSSPVVISTSPRGQCASPKYCCAFEKGRDIRYFLYCAEVPKAGLELPSYNLRKLSTVLGAYSVNKTLPTIVYIHGFAESTTTDSSTTIRDAYLSRGGYNLVLVDWGNLAAFPWYMTAVRNCPLTSQHVAKFLQDLHLIGLSINNMHLIGFSLGAEIAGFTGKQLRHPDGSPQLRRITGLDPAYPLYDSADNNHKLHQSDAEFVDVIHTDAGTFGFPTNMGHADFFPNGGSHYQPGCSPSHFQGDSANLSLFLACSHQRAWRYYIESVQLPNSFPASKCTNKNCQMQIDAYMGFATKNTSRGSFYLTTNSNSPFGRHIT